MNATAEDSATRAPDQHRPNSSSQTFSTPHTAARHAYRPDVDGLRAVAVGAVLIFHAFPATLPGGFVGVDIFFVISGFLITGIIIESIDAGRFSIADFYSRRIRRIFPALGLVLLATLVAGWFALLPDDFERLGKHVAGGAGFISNLVLWRESGYFDTDAALKPLLHLWSLGIEEQYYLVWPLLLIFVRRIRWPLLTVVAIIGILSFALNVAMVENHPVETFYLPVTRFWELMIGGAVALWRYAPTGAIVGRELPPWAASAATYAGACAVVGSILILDEHRAFPGWWALLVTTGTAMVIAFGQGTWLNRNVLSSRPFVFVGLISYPLYLWHWPLLAFGNIIEHEPTVMYRVLALVASVIAATLTYRFVETPIRQYKAAGLLHPIVLGLAGMVAVGGLAGLASYSGWVAPRSAADAQLVAISEAAGDWAYKEDRELVGNVPGAVVYIGDSHLQQYWPAVERFASDPTVSRHTIRFVTLAGCAPVPGLERKGKGCAAFMDRALAEAQRPDVRTVVIAGSWFGFASREDYVDANDLNSPAIRVNDPGGQWVYDGLKAMIADLRASGRRVVVLLDGPRGTEYDPKSRIYWRGLAIHAKPAPVVHRDEILELIGAANVPVRDAAIQGGAEVIDPMDWFCQGTTCPTADEHGEPIYLDESHVRRRYARSMRTPLEELARASSPPPGG